MDRILPSGSLLSPFGKYLFNEGGVGSCPVKRRSEPLLQSLVWTGKYSYRETSQRPLIVCLPVGPSSSWPRPVPWSLPDCIVWLLLGLEPRLLAVDHTSSSVNVWWTNIHVHVRMVIEQKNYSFPPQPKRKLVIFIDCCGGKKDCFSFYLHSIGNNKANEREV